MLRNTAFVFILVVFLRVLSSCHHDGLIQTQEMIKVRCDFSGYHIPNLCEDEKRYLDRVKALYPNDTISDLTRSRLQKITRETEDIDIAASLYYLKTIEYRPNAELIEYLEKQGQVLQKTKPDYSSKGILLAMVPGMFYRDNPTVGADGAGLRSSLSKIGIQSEVIPIDQTGTSEDNARIICTYIEKSNAKSILIASASKGGLDFRIAIRQCGRASFFKQKVKGWVNIGGLLYGSKVINAIEDSLAYRLEAWSYFFIHNYKWKGLLSMQDSWDGDQAMSLPEGMVMVNVVGVPLFRHVTERARPFYLYLAGYGPNDGFVLLADTIQPQTYILPLWRNDHYFAWGISEQKIQALALFMLNRAGPGVTHKDPVPFSQIRPVAR